MLKQAAACSCEPVRTWAGQVETLQGGGRGFGRTGGRKPTAGHPGGEAGPLLSRAQRGPSPRVCF